jgi:hypothetical protein
MSSPLTTAGRVSLVNDLKNMDLFLAWGTGQASWDDDDAPVFDAGASALVAELGRRRIMNKQFVVPNDNGDITVDGQKYSIYNGITQYLYLEVIFDVTEAPTDVIRELAVFRGVETQEGLPDGQMYFLPDQIVAQGTVLAGDNFAGDAKITRNNTTHEKFYFVLTL